MGDKEKKLLLEFAKRYNRKPSLAELEERRKECDRNDGPTYARKGDVIIYHSNRSDSYEDQKSVSFNSLAAVYIPITGVSLVMAWYYLVILYRLIF